MKIFENGFIWYKCYKGSILFFAGGFFVFLYQYTSFKFGSFFPAPPSGSPPKAEK